MSNRYLPGPTWTEQDEELRNKWQEGVPPEKIAEGLNRTVAAVMTRAARLGLPRRFAPGRKPRQARSEYTPAAAKITKSSAEKAAAENSNKQVRVCLMCVSDFYSAGPHNRICPKCKESPDYTSASRLPDLNISF